MNTTESFLVAAYQLCHSLLEWVAKVKAGDNRPFGTVFLPKDE